MNTPKRLQTAVIACAILASGSLAACGSGGGGSTGGGSIVPTPISTPTVKPAPQTSLRAGFVPGASSAAPIANGARTLSVSRHTEALSSELVPTEDYYLPNGYISFTGQEGPGSYYAVAYYDSNAPNPVPSGTWTQSGNVLTAYAPVIPSSNIRLPAGDTFASFEGYQNPAATGTTVLTYTDTLGNSSSINGYTYNGSALNDGNSGETGSGECLTFGPDQSATPGTSGDLCLEGNANSGTTEIVAAYGAVLVNKDINSITAADIATVPNGSSTVQSLTIFNAESGTGAIAETIVAHTAAGGVVKMNVLTMTSGVGRNLATGQADYIYGGYRVGTSAGFDE